MSRTELEDVRRAAIVNNLGRVLKRMGNVGQAREHFESALRLDQETYGEAHPHVAEVANNYGTVLHMAGDVKTALHQFEWALEICRNSYGPEHAKVATITNNIAYALANSGDVDRALEYFMQALSTAEATCGPTHPLVATIRTNLGIALRLKGQTDAAHAEFERAAAIGQATLGPDHTDVARSLAANGRDQLRAERLGWRQYFQRALDIDERALGPNHLLISARLNDLGRCLKALNDVDGRRLLRARRGSDAGEQFDQPPRRPGGLERFEFYLKCRRCPHVPSPAVLAAPAHCRIPPVRAPAARKSPIQRLLGIVSMPEIADATIIA